MLRRNLILAAAGVVLTGCGGDDDPPPAPSQACNLSGFPASTAAVNMSAFFQSAAQLQQQNMWCWAACIAMIFAYRGHPISQTRIVTEAYGAPFNMPAPGFTIAQALNRSWFDDLGRRFTSQVTGIYDAQFGLLAISNSGIVSTLAGGTPMIIGTGSHARVLTEVNYQSTAGGPNIVGGAVFDPFTGRVQCLTLQELFPAHLNGALIFLASVVVS